MAKIIAVTNQKGGVGKTMTTENVGIGLARLNNRVLLIDMDPQGSLSASLGIKEPDELEVSLANILAKEVNEYEIEEGYGIIHHEEGVDLIPGNINLSALDMQLNNIDNKEFILKNYLLTIKDNYDFILIDCMPSLGVLTLNALCSADSLLIPMQANYLPAKGLVQLLKTVQKLKRELNPALQIEGLVFTMVDERTNLIKDMELFIKLQYGNYIRIFDSRIPFSVKAGESTIEGKSIFRYANKNPVARAYENLVNELLTNEIIEI